MKNISCHLPGRSIKALFLSHLVEKKGFETSIRGILTGQFRSFSRSGYAWKRPGNSPGGGPAKLLLSQAASFPTVSASSPAQLCATFTRVCPSIHVLDCSGCCTRPAHSGRSGCYRTYIVSEPGDACLGLVPYISYVKYNNNSW